MALLVELVADRPDPAVHHVARRDRVGAGLGVGDRRFRQQLDGDVVVDLAVADEAAVAVRGVLAEADVGDHRQVGVGLLQRPHRHLHDALVVVGAAAASRPWPRGSRRGASRRPRGWRSRSPRRPAPRSRSARSPASTRPPRAPPRRRRRTRAGSAARASSSVSRTRPRRASVRRRRRRRVAGKGIAVDSRETGSFPPMDAGIGATAALEARGLVKDYGERAALRGVDFSVDAGRAAGGDRAERRRQDDAALDPGRGRQAADRGEVSLPGGEVGWVPAAGGALPPPHRRGEPAPLRPAGGARGPARLGRGDARAVRARRAARTSPSPGSPGGTSSGSTSRSACSRGRSRCSSTSPASASTRASGRGSGSSSRPSPGAARR